MSIHGVISSYFGDNELDVGKSVTWTQLFCDTEFILDAQRGDTIRRFVIDWSKTFPEAEFSYKAGTNFLASQSEAADWRKASFNKADIKFGYSDDDWVVFVDATEGLSVDDQFPPESFVETYDGNPFKAYILGEISSSGPDADMLYMPVWAYTRDSSPFKVFSIIDQSLEDYLDLLALSPGSIPSGIYAGVSAAVLRAANTTETVSAHSYYTYAGFLPRLIKVSALRSPGFDWSILDTFVEVVPDEPSSAECQEYLSLISYAYARWAAPEDIDQETGLAISESTDIGYQMRQAISEVRPIAGLETVSWAVADDVDESAPNQLLADYSDPRTKFGLDATPGPQFSTAFNSSTLNFNRREVPPDPDAWTADIELLTPLYETTFRGNPREGIFYLDKTIGPIPWDEVTGQPAIDPATWDYRTMLDSNPKIGS